MAHEFDYDLFVIGAGSGGVRAARMSASYGAKVAIAEEFRIGGTCVIRGCVPKKLMVYASGFAHEAAAIAPAYGWTFSGASFDWATLRDNIANEVTRLSGIYQRNLGNSGVEIFQQKATIAGPNAIKMADGTMKTAAHILIATGGTPFLPDDVDGIEHVITSDDVFSMPSLPQKMLIAGGGYIAIEFAFLMAGLGVEVSLLYRGDRLLRGFDEDLRDDIHHALENSSIKLITNTVFGKIEKGDNGLVAHLRDGQMVEADVIMAAIGRRPYTKGLGLENAGVATGENEKINVDQYSQTNVANIYAVGDVTDRVALTPVAIREGAAVAATLFNNAPTPYNHETIATAVFSQPPIGTVGLSEAEARAAFGEVRIFKTRFKPMRTSFAGDPRRTLMKLIVRASDDVVVGCHIMGDDAAEMIQMVGIAVKAGLTKAQFDDTCAVHPTAAEELVTMKTPEPEPTA